MKAHFSIFVHVDWVTMALMIVTTAVGAGYTGFLARREETALIDFGGESTGRAMDALFRVADRHCPPWRYFGLRPMPLTPFGAFLLSHPHEDHYNGLRAFAAQQQRDPTLRPLLTRSASFYHPRLPSDPVATEFALRLAALESVERVMSGVPDFTVIRAIRRCGGITARRKPLRRGHTVKLAGETFDVLWPPDQLPEDARTHLRKLVDRYDALAEEAATEEDTHLKDALNRLREPETFDIEDALYGSAETADEEQQGPPEQREHDPTDKGPTRDGHDSRYTKRLGELKDAVKNGANFLSIVLASQADRRYVFLGDLDRSLHGAIAPDLLEFQPEVVSSAHHGTHFDSALETLRSRYVISSVGGKLKNNVCPEYDSMGMHLRTDRAGDIFALMLSGRTAVCSRPTA